MAERLIADFERLVLRILGDLTESLRSVQSMSQGGEYEDTRLWSVEHDLKLLTALIDGSECGRG